MQKFNTYALAFRRPSLLLLENLQDSSLHNLAPDGNVYGGSVYRKQAFVHHSRTSLHQNLNDLQSGAARFADEAFIKIHGGRHLASPDLMAVHADEQEFVTQLLAMLPQTDYSVFVKSHQQHVKDWFKQVPYVQKMLARHPSAGSLDMQFSIYFKGSDPRDAFGKLCFPLYSGEPFTLVFRGIRGRVAVESVEMQQTLQLLSSASGQPFHAINLMGQL